MIFGFVFSKYAVEWVKIESFILLLKDDVHIHAAGTTCDANDMLIYGLFKG